MKKVMHVALIAPQGYTSDPFLKAFMNSGFNQYFEFDYQKERFQNGIEGMRKNMIDLAERTKPELLFLHVQNSEILDIGTVRTLSKIGFTVLYTFDCRTKEKTQWMYDLAPHLGMVCFSNEEDVNHCKELGYENSFVVQSSFNDEVYAPPSEECLKRGIVFIGGNYVDTNLGFPLAHERVDMVDFLRKTYADKFTALGMGWGNSTLIRPHEEASIYYGCEIAINHNNFDRKLYTSDRLWRIMATGTFCLTKSFKGIETIFERGVHLDWWKDFGELKEKIDYYLNDPKERLAIEKAGSLYVRENHNWTSRIKEILSRIPKKEKKLCIDAHRWGGVIPTAFDERFDGQSCDCKKLIASWELCGCGDPIYQLRLKENV